MLAEDSVQNHFGGSYLLSKTVVNLASDSATFVVLHGHEAAGEPSKFGRPEIDHPFQFDRAVADRLFQHFAVMDIGTSSIPLEDVPDRISKRDSTGAEPAVLPVNAADTVFGLIGFPGLHASHPERRTSFFVVRMQILQPAESNGRACRSTCIFIKSAADVVPPTIRLPAENNIGCGVHNGVEFLVLLGKVAVELLQSHRFLF